MARSTKTIALGFYSAAMAVAGLLALAALAQEGGPDPDVKLPDYREWTHVKSMVIFDEAHPLFNAFGGMHHVYANEKALAGTKAGGPYPDGSALVFVLYDVENAGGAYQAAGKKVTAVMLKDSRRYKNTGGWAFQAWDPSGAPLVTDGGASCFACHANGASSTDYVFSRFVP